MNRGTTSPSPSPGPAAQEWRPPSSTGVLQPLKGPRELLDDRDGMLIVDTVTSLGGHLVGVDRHGINVCYSGTQKALSCPPGLAPITFSGLGPLRGRIWRIGLMGSGSTANHVLLLGALERVLAFEGFKGGPGVSTANAIYVEARTSFA